MQSGIFKLLGLQPFSTRGWPAAWFFGPLGATVELIGGVMLILGLATRYACLVMLLFMIIATFSNHRFWDYPPAEMQGQRSHFFKNLSIFGGFLAFYALGAGRLSLDWLLRRGRSSSASSVGTPSLHRADPIDDATRDRHAIRDCLENWAIWRDIGDFERLRTCFHDDGRMNATWFQGTPDEFVARARGAFARGSMSTHALGGMSIDVVGARAVAQTRVTLRIRDMLEGVPHDITCIGRFYDLLEKRAGRWAICERRLTYEMDRADPVNFGTSAVLDQALLDSFPPGYRYLAYAQTRQGHAVYRDLPGVRGPEAEALYAKGKSWLAGASA